MKQSNGYIAVESEMGKGCSFRIYLPRIEQAAAALRKNIPASTAVRGGETILLVEDAEPLRRLEHLLLSASGYLVLPAANGSDALQVAAQHDGPIHMLLTDVVMPGMNGRVLGERLRARQRSIAVLYVSGYTDNFIAGHGVLDAGVHLLRKPFTEEQFLRKVREVLEENNPARAAGAAPVLAGPLRQA